MHAGMKVHNTRYACTYVSERGFPLRQEGVGVVVFEGFLLLFFFWLLLLLFLYQNM